MRWGVFILGLVSAIYVVLGTFVLAGITMSGGLYGKDPVSDVTYVLGFGAIFLAATPLFLFVTYGWCKFRKRPLPTWAKVASYVISAGMLGLGLVSLFLDPGDFPFVGLPLLICAIMLTVFVRRGPRYE